jgi:hypothetical protein
MNVTSPYFAVVAFLGIILIMGLVGQCQYKEEQELPRLTREQRSEIMSRQSEFDREQHVDMADRILAARTERAWREKQ